MAKAVIPPTTTPAMAPVGKVRPGLATGVDDLATEAEAVAGLALLEPAVLEGSTSPLGSSSPGASIIEEFSADCF